MSDPLAARLAPTQTKIVVHHLNDSRSQRILWLLEELELPYEIKKYQRGPDQLAPKELYAVNPLGKSPAISDEDLVLAESGAIVEYLIDKYGRDKDRPSEAGKLDNLYYTHYAEGTLMPLLVNKYIFSIIPSRMPFFLRPVLWFVFGKLDSALIEPGLKKNRELIENHLTKMKNNSSGCGWFAGGDHPTSADYMMSFPLEMFVSSVGAGDGDRITGWVKNMHERPAYKRALEKGGEYAYAIPEAP